MRQQTQAQNPQQNSQPTVQQSQSGLEVLMRGARRNTGKFLAGAMIFALGMGVEAKTNYVHKTNEHAKMIRYAVEGYRLEGDPHYRDAKIELHVDHDNQVIYGAIVDEGRDISVKINEGLITRDSVPKEFYRLVKTDLENLWDGVNSLKDDVKIRSEKGAKNVWEQTKDAYQNLSEEIENKLR